MSVIASNSNPRVLLNESIGTITWTAEDTIRDGETMAVPDPPQFLGSTGVEF